MQRPYSQACENNKRPILERLRCYLNDGDRVLEIGSGTGQHAVFFGAELPAVIWQTSDLAPHHEGIRLWLASAALPNVLPPLVLDVTRRDWGAIRYDAVFSANTAHIMSWSVVEAMIAGAGRIVRTDGLFLLYGPFSYAGRHTSESNARFDLSLKLANPAQGLRDFEAVESVAAGVGLRFVADHAMPANNRLVVWRRLPKTWEPVEEVSGGTMRR